MVSDLREAFRSQRWLKLRSPSEISVFFQDQVRIPLVFFRPFQRLMGVLGYREGSRGGSRTESR